jgi:hypothetical protein
VLTLSACNTELPKLMVNDLAVNHRLVQALPTYDWCTDRPQQTECTGEWCSLWDHLVDQPDFDLPDAYPGYTDWMPCCDTPSGWTIAVRPAAACQSTATACDLTSEYGWNVIVLHSSEYDQDCP